MFLAGLQIKRKFACPFFGPRIKSHRSRILGKEVFDEYRHFLPKNHKYQTTKKTKFNGKEENGKKPRRMTSHLWNLEYNRHRHSMQIVYVAYKYIIL